MGTSAVGKVPWELQCKDFMEEIHLAFRLERVKV